MLLRNFLSFGSLPSTHRPTLRARPSPSTTPKRAAPFLRERPGQNASPFASTLSYAPGIFSKRQNACVFTVAASAGAPRRDLHAFAAVPSGGSCAAAKASPRVFPRGAAQGGPTKPSGTLTCSPIYRKRGQRGRGKTGRPGRLRPLRPLCFAQEALKNIRQRTRSSLSRPLPIPHRHMLMLGALQKPLMFKLLMVPLETAAAPPAAALQRLPGREFWLNFVPSLKSGTA